MTYPSLPTRNLVKFQLMALLPSRTGALKRQPPVERVRAGPDDVDLRRHADAQTAKFASHGEKHPRGNSILPGALWHTLFRVANRGFTDGYHDASIARINPSL